MIYSNYTILSPLKEQKTLPPERFLTSKYPRNGMEKGEEGKVAKGRTPKLKVLASLCCKVKLFFNDCLWILCCQ